MNTIFQKVEVPDEKIICPNCGQRLSANAAQEPANKISPGDISICLYCESILIFNQDCATRHVATGQELESIKADKESWAGIESSLKSIRNAKKLF